VLVVVFVIRGTIAIGIGGISIGVVCAERVSMLVSAGGDEIERDPGRAKDYGWYWWCWWAPAVVPWYSGEGGLGFGWGW
jgi:hypothetical protein